MTTQADVDALRAAAARGVLTVRFADGRQVTYASPTELLTIAAKLEGQIASADFPRTTYTGFARD